MLLFVGFFSICTVAMSQSSGLQVSDNGAIVLDETQPLKSSYVMPASAFNFATQEQAIAYFAQKHTEMVAYRPVMQNGEIMVFLQVNRQPTWSAADWNAYFAANKVRNTQSINQSSTTNQ